jgi:multiple sugar transport system permease protein
MKNFSLLSTRAGALFLTPAALLVGLFVIIPFFWVIIVSFTNRTLLGTTALNPDFVGLQNYIALFNPDTFFTRGQFGFSLILTIQFVLLSALLGQALLGLLLAWLSQSVPPAVKSGLQTAVIAAWILPEVVIGFAWFAFLDYDNGTFNTILRSLGLPPGDWLLQQPFLVIVFFNTWRGAAFSMMLFNSAFQSIPPSYFQAADVAGATSWQKLRDIAMPLIRGHVVTDLILITMWTFNVFTPFLLTNGGPSYRTEILSIYTYRVAFKDFEFGKGAAVGVVIMLINLAFALVYLRIARKKPEEAEQ